MIKIADLADGSGAVDMNQALLARGQAHLRVVTLFGHELGSSTGAAHKLTAPPWM